MPNTRIGAPPGAVIWPKPKERKLTLQERINHLNYVKAKLEATFHSGAWGPDIDVYNEIVRALDARIEMIITAEI